MPRVTSDLGVSHEWMPTLQSNRATFILERTRYSRKNVVRRACVHPQVRGATRDPTTAVAAFVGSGPPSRVVPMDKS